MLNPIAETLAQEGRKGDTEIGHLTTGEVIIPAEIMAAVPGLAEMVAQAFQAAGADIGQYTVGGGDDSVNPATAMPEYGWNDDEGDTGSGWGGNDGNMATDDFGGNDDGGSYYNQPVDRGPVPGWSPSQNSPRSIIGNEPSEIGGGNVSMLGVSPAQYSNPMSGQTHYGAGFNPGAFAGGVLGSLSPVPGGAIAGSLIGRQMADTRFGFPGMDSVGYGMKVGDPGAQQPNQGDGNVLAKLLLQQKQQAPRA